MAGITHAVFEPKSELDPKRRNRITKRYFCICDSSLKASLISEESSVGGGQWAQTPNSSKIKGVLTPRELVRDWHHWKSLTRVWNTHERHLLRVALKVHYPYIPWHLLEEISDIFHSLFHRCLVVLHGFQHIFIKFCFKCFIWDPYSQNEEKKLMISFADLF